MEIKNFRQEPDRLYFKAIDGHIKLAVLNARVIHVVYTRCKDNTA
jgi:hypothetical protein